MSLQIDYLVRKEQYQDMIRAAQQDQIIQMAKQYNHKSSWHRQMVAWFGTQLVNWGITLQHYGMLPHESSLSTPQLRTE